MAFRWDLLLPTKTTLIRQRDPTVADAYYDYGVIWINKPDNKAWLLKDGVIYILPPTSGMVTDIGSWPNYGDVLQDVVDIVETTMDEYMKKEIYDTDLDNVVDEAETIDGGNF